MQGAENVTEVVDFLEQGCDYYEWWLFVVED